MSEHTTIEWCDISLSPWWGCTKVSPGCFACYMMVLLKRWKGGRHCGKGQPRLRIESFRANALRHDRRAAKLGKRLTVFPSMCDPLDAEVPIEWFVDFLETIRLTPNLTWLFLTKRPELWAERIWAAELHAGCDLKNSDLANWISDWRSGKPPVNVWMMASTEDQLRANERIPELLRIPAVKRGLSVEPMLGPVDFVLGMHGGQFDGEPKGKLDWIICGGESGHGARHIDIEWVRALRDQCAAAGVPFFFKQWGGRTPKARGRLLDGKQHSEVPA